MDQINDKNTPICECHSFPMYFKVDKRRRSGGYWQCRIKRRELLRNWRRDNDKYKSKHRKDQKKYQHSVKGYVKIRKRELTKMREETVNKLKELQNVN